MEFTCVECGAELPLRLEPAGGTPRCQLCKDLLQLTQASAKKQEDDGQFTDSPPPTPRPQKGPRRDANEPSVAKSGGSSVFIWVILGVGLVFVLLLCVAGVAGMGFIFAMRTQQVEVAAQRAEMDVLVQKKAMEEALAKADGRPLDDAKVKVKLEPPPNNLKGDRAIIRDVMRKAMNKGMGRDFVSGKATDDQKQQLLTLMTDFVATRSPKGNDADWNTRTSALLAAVKANDTAAYTKASDCMGCHQLHKGKK